MRYLSLFILALLYTGCYNVERTCSDFKTGTFEFEQLVGTELITSRFTRNDSIAIETYKSITDTFSIRWINDCEYIMRKLNPQTPYDEEAVHFKILSTKDNTYNFEFRMVVKKENQKRLVKKGIVTKIAD